MGEHWCGDAMELEGTGLICTSIPDLSRHPRELSKKDSFWQGENELRVKRCHTTWSCAITQFCRSTKSQTLHMKPQARTNRVCICMLSWYDRMMSIYSVVSRIYPPHQLVGLEFMLQYVAPPMSLSQCPVSLYLLIPSHTEFFNVTSRSPHTHHELSSATLRCCGRKESIFLQ